MSSGFELEVTLTSAKDLKNVNWRYGPTRPYAVIWINPDRKVTTRVNDHDDDEDSPNWNEKFVLPLTQPIDDNTTLYIDIVHAKTPDEENTKPLIGSAKLRLRDILDEAGGYNVAAIQKLKLKRPSGRPHGKVLIEAVVYDRRYGYGAAPPQYGVRGYGDDAPPAPGNYGYVYSAPPPPHEQYGVGSAGYGNYGGAGAPIPQSYGEVPQQQQYYGGGEQEKKSKFGGMGTGLAVGAAAGVVGGVALVAGYDAVTDEIAEDAAEKVEENEDEEEDYGDEDDE